VNTPTPETEARSADHIGFWSCATVPTEFARKLERERDAWKASHDNQVELKRLLMDRPDLKERAKLISELRAERDQLRKVADELRGAWRSYRAFPTLKNERLIESAVENYENLPHVKAKWL